MKKILIIFMMLLFSLAAFAENYSIQKLPNGQTVIVYEIHNNPIVTIDTWIRTGSINETDKNNGISHFLEHLFFKGTKAHPTGEADKILESKGAVVNAATSKDFTHYYIKIPSEFFDTALDLHADMLLNPQIPRKELEKERKVVIEEISKDGNTPSKQVYDNLNELMYTTHPYKRKVIGTVENVSTMRREEIIDYFNKYYTPSNMITLIVGDVKTADALEKVQKLFNQEYKKPVKNNFAQEKSIQNQKRKIDYTDTQTGYMIIGFRGAKISSSDTFALDVLAEILGGGKSSKLYKIIKEQKDFAYSISASNGSYKDDGIFYINANFTPGSHDKLEKAIFEEIDYIKKYGVTEEELNRAKNKIIQDTYYSRESTSDIASELGYITTLTGSPNLYNTYIENVKKVSACDIQNTAQKYLGYNKSAISIILPNEYKNPTTKQPAKYSGKFISENCGVSKYTIDNGATLLIGENKNNDIISINIIIKGGEFIENKTGEGTLTASTLLKGTKKYSALELAQIMEENGIKINADCRDDFFVIYAQTTTAQINKTLEILDEIINNAQFNEQELEKKRSEILSRIKQKHDIPMNIALDNFKSLIFENSIYSNTNSVLEKTMPLINRNDVVNYYNKIMNSKNMIVSINGNIDKQCMLDTFGTILPMKNSPKIDFNNYKITKLNQPKTATKTIKDLQTSWLFLGWQTAGVQDKKDFVTLKVINTILGSGLSSRLYQNLRESDGLAYQLGTTYSPKMLGGFFMGYIGTNPATLEYSREKMLNEINRLKIEFVSDKELQDAKNRLKGGFIVALETNSEKALNTGMFEAYGFGYDFLNTYVKMIDEVRASDIVKVANKYFNANIVQSDVR